MKALSSGGFEGVAKIVQFNSRYYVASALGVASVVLLLIFVRMPIWLEAPALFAATLMLFWTLSSLFVSWYVYDYAGVTRWEWMRPDLHRAPPRWVNIHAGLDESTAALRRLLPDTDGVVVDIYDPATMTEPSIASARRMYPASEPFQTGSAKALPLPDGDRDAIFLLFAAHELRDPDDRTNLFLEVRRILKSDGRILLVEHLRDRPNFIAFGPGFLHFHAARSWRRNIGEAGLVVVEQRKVTPFVQCFILQRAGA
jgi:SAM-dependent methyltransferase